MSMNTMHFSSKIFLIVSVFFCAVGSLSADEKADEILKRARFSSTLQVQDLVGQLRKNGKKSSVALYLRKEDIQFQYFKDNKWQKFHMQLKEGGGKLFRLIDGKKKHFNKADLATPILGTDLTYEDLSMNFLYWDNAKWEKQERVKTQKCDVLRLENPGSGGKYKVVYVWVHVEYGAIMRVVGYDEKGRRLKEFAVDKIMKVGKEYTLRTMKVESFNPDNKKKIGNTYLEFSKPKVANKPL